MSIAQPPHQHSDEPNACFVCKYDLPFEMPEDLLEACIEGKLVIFAGAGISTENRKGYPHTFYEQILSELAHNGPDLTFPQVMTAYCDMYGRASLLQKIKHRFDYAKAFPELYLWSTLFHRELATIPPIRDIVTTNWDTFFEDLTGAIPIVTPKDYAFWELPQRKVFKIHGSMNNPSTLAATESDYKNCYKQLRAGLIGGYLRHLLATKTVVFIGYSFRDTDFNRIYGYLKREMEEILPRSYIVTVDSEFSSAKHPSSTVIYTDGAYFLSELKRILVERKLMFPDSYFEGLHEILHEANEANVELFERFRCSTHPAIVYAASYQDGLRHAIQRILAYKHTGEYSDPHHFFHRMESYELLRKGAVKAKKYYDVAYIEGYLNRNYCFIDEESRDSLPVYFIFGSDKLLRTLDEFAAEQENAERLHRTAFAKAKKEAREIGDMVPHHFPFLNLNYASIADGKRPRVQELDDA